MKILAIETSCDETAAAVVEDGRRVLSNAVASQIEIHRRFGGVVPEIASRNHTLAIESTVRSALDEAGAGRDDIDAVAVTYGAGLLGALLVGVNFAKALAYAWDKPLYAVSHIRGHIAANYIDSDLEPPYVCLLASGGHTAVLRVDDYSRLTCLGQTGDDAAGEAFDKVARVLGLPYPGGPEIQKLAAEGAPRFHMPRPVFKDGGAIRFSYSGLKTYVVNLVHTLSQRGEDIPRADIAASFQAAAVGQLTEGAAAALRSTGLGKLSVAGGVGANALLREEAKKVAEKAGASLHYPALRYCTDNAAMIGAAAYFDIMSGAEPAPLALDAKATVRLA